MNRHELRLLVIEKFGGKCVQCGFSDARALQIDHKNGGGKKEHDKLGRYQMYLKALKNSKASIKNRKYQILCANCNWIKRYENKEHGTHKPV